MTLYFLGYILDIWDWTMKNQQAKLPYKIDMIKGYRRNGNLLRTIVASFVLTQGFSPPPPRHLVKYNFTSVIYHFALQQSNVKNFSNCPAFTLARTSSCTECYVAGFFCCI